MRLRVTAVPGVHGPGPLARILPPVQGSLLELAGAREPFRVYVTGDVLFRPALGAVVERAGRPDALVIHLGGTRILGVLLTMDARQGTDLVELLTPRVTIPIHHGDYPVFRSPLREFLAEVGRRVPAADIRVVERGGTVSLQPYGQEAVTGDHP